MDISRFNGLRSQRYVCAFVLSLLGSPDLGKLNRQRLLNKKAAAGLSRYMAEYADKQGMYMKINFVNPDHVHALIDFPPLSQSRSSSNFSREALHTGLMPATSSRGNLRGPEDMERSRCRSQTQIRWRDISRIKKNIIAYALSQRNCENLSTVTGCVGTTKKAVETANSVLRCMIHRPEGRC